MVFASPFFLYIFMPLCIVLYFLCKTLKAKNIVLLVFSLIFYAWGEPWFVFVMAGTAFLDWFHSMVIENFRDTRLAKLSMIVSVITDIGILMTFKYSGFIVENINVLLPFDIPVPQVSLPIGISFYTFQTLTYVVDVYRGKVHAQKNYFRYLLYLSSFFQLVAGPIVRYEYVDGYLENRQSTFKGAALGFCRFATGLAKKTVIADVAFEFVTKYMDGNLSTVPTLGAWFGMLMFTVQIYFDFSGYSDMAIGLAQIFGFSFPENFDHPYISKSVTEFWRRWHISLGSFFRDYVYIPLGGNRTHHYRNLFIVWLLTGVWHGASWNFVLWGLYNGAFIMLEKKFPGFFKKLPAVLSHLYLIVIVNFGFMIFHYTDFSRIGNFMGALFGFGERSFITTELSLDFMNNIFWLIAVIILCAPIKAIIARFLESIENISTTCALSVGIVRIAYVTAVLFVCTAFLVGDNLNAFLYYNF